MSDITKFTDGLSFPNARPVQPEKASPESNPPKEHNRPIIPVVSLRLSTHTDIPARKPRQKQQTCQDFTIYRGILEFRCQLLKLIRMIGFSDYFFQKLIWEKQDKQPFGTLPRQLRAIYEEEKFFEHDLALQHIRATASPIFMSFIENFIFEAKLKSDTFRRYDELITVCKRFGYHDFYYIPLKARDDCCSVMLAVTVKDMNSVDFRRRVEMDKDELNFLAQAIFCKGVNEYPSLFLNTKSSRKVNSSRPMQLLNVLAKDDMCLKQASDKLCISIDTANKHMASAKKALGVRTQPAAVYRAIKAGVIEI